MQNSANDLCSKESYINLEKQYQELNDIFKIEIDQKNTISTEMEDFKAQFMMEHEERENCEKKITELQSQNSIVENDLLKKNEEIELLVKMIHEIKDKSSPRSENQQSIQSDEFSTILKNNINPHRNLLDQ